MITQTVGYEQIVALAKTLPEEKLASWYEYGLFIQSRAVETPGAGEQGPEAFAQEMAQWEAASDEDWLAFEDQLEEAV